MLLLLIMSTLPGCFCVDFTYHVEEGKNPGTLVGDIATDTNMMNKVDVQDQNEILFTLLQQQNITGNSPLFRVSNTGKLYTAQTLDAEYLCRRKTECFKMVDIAVRRTETFLSIYEIKVIIEDVNDHQPEFPVERVNIEFSENDAIGTKLAIPNAVDRDVGVLNSKITYLLKNNENEPFTLFVSKSVVGTSQLAINLDERLDREIQDVYMIQVIAKDAGSPPRQSVLDVRISVSDVNDKVPIFSQNIYNVSIENNHDGAIPVAIVFATDMDSGKNGGISYHFSSETSDLAKMLFKLNEETGEIFLHKKFELGRELTYKLYIKAIDGGSPPLSSLAMVQVNVINQQNNAPTIDVNFVSASRDNTATISEDIKVGSFIAFVKVTDHDAGQNGEISCILHHDKFQLQNFGNKKYKVTVKNSVDRETEDHHDITISCQDKGTPPLYCESTFSIQVMDVNDEKPQISKETFKFSIFENQKSKIPVGIINATDPDQGSGGKFTYSLMTNSKQFLPFQINDVGLISTIMSLDHEFQDIYRFQVIVKDNGIPSLNNTVNVIVEVRDENDNAPYFTFPSINPFTIDVLYYPHHTKNITVLKASDSDSRENAFLKYEIISGNDKQLFTINHYTGLLSFTHVVTPQDAGSYELEFVVKDSGNPILSATTTMFVALTVSNKTSDMLNTVHVQTEDTIDLNLAIVIVLVAVTLSVIITAALSICILRCNNHRNVPSCEDGMNTSQRCVSEQRHLMCPSYQGTCWSDAPVAITTDSFKTSNTQAKGTRRESHPGCDLSNKLKDSPPALKPRSSAESSRQMCIEEVAVPPSGEKLESCRVMVPDYNPTRRSTQSSHTDSGRGWSEGDTGHSEEVPGM